MSIISVPRSYPQRLRVSRNTKGLQQIVVAFSLSCIVIANHTRRDPRLERLFSSYMAPCCWQGNLLQHDSPKAEHLRVEIRQLVAQGKSDDNIKAVVVTEHSRRVLALPEGPAGDLLWWIPWLVVLLGVIAVLITIRRLRSGTAPVSTPVSTDSELEGDFE